MHIGCLIVKCKYAMWNAQYEYDLGNECMMSLLVLYKMKWIDVRKSLGDEEKTFFAHSKLLQIFFFVSAHSI